MPIHLTATTSRERVFLFAQSSINRGDFINNETYMEETLSGMRCVSSLWNCVKVLTSSHVIDELLHQHDWQIGLLLLISIENPNFEAKRTNDTTDNERLMHNVILLRLISA